MTFTDEQLERYSRQIVLNGFGGTGQEKLHRGSALVVGLGGLGLPVAMYLAGAGIGRLGLADRDAISPSNLHRQVWYGMGQVGTPKVVAAAEAIRALNPDVRVETHVTRLEDDRPTHALASNYDILIDCSDNAPTRHLLGRLSHIVRKPLVHGAAIGFKGYVAAFDSAGNRDAPCYHCFFREEDGMEHGATCTAAGVLGPVPGVIGTLQSVAAVRILAGIGEPGYGRLTVFDALTQRFHQSHIIKDPECPLCSKFIPNP